mmetsp:Transcript_5429/g.12358  ORF Transcript_5429/g.12358 Transcript_5429/m.12358 type:complete len:619 (-) Transcript_5429:188-2044(-)
MLASSTFTCSSCNRNETRFPNLPCGPCRKRTSHRGRRGVASSAHRKSGFVFATVACLALMSTPLTAVTATRTIANSGIVWSTSSSLKKKLSTLKLSAGRAHQEDEERVAEIRLLEQQLFASTSSGHEEDEGLAVDVDAALAAVTNGGDVDPLSSHEEHNDDHDEHHDDHDEHNDDPNDEFHTTSSTQDSYQEKAKPWGYVILATLIVNLASLTGLLLLLIPAIHRGYLNFQGLDSQAADGKKGRLFDVCIPAFAVGALMATAFFLVMPEALHLIEGKHSDESGDEHSDHRVLAEEDGHDNHEDHMEEEGQTDAHADHNDSPNSESLVAAKFGVAVLGEFLLPMLFGLAFHRHSPSSNISTERVSTPLLDVDDDHDAVASRKLSVVTGDDEGCDCCTKENDDVETGVVVREVVDADRPLPETIVLNVSEGSTSPPPSQAINNAEEEKHVEEVQTQSEPLATKVHIDYRLISSVIVGDAFCNFVDGLFVGAAFLSCSWATTLSILLVTLFHELPQELADFLLLTRYAGLSTSKACIVNFGSGLIVTLGGVVVLAGDTSDEIVGVILAMAGGCYINIAACETVPRIEQHVHSLADRVAMVFSFIIGTVPIGLVLLKHEHCE